MPAIPSPCSLSGIYAGLAITLSSESVLLSDELHLDRVLPSMTIGQRLVNIFLIEPFLKMRLDERVISEMQVRMFL